jgi:ABC-2 type transport system ATP-binding protein
MSLIRFHNIKKTFGKKEVLSNVSFEINEGEIFGLVGRSGGGKTTLLKILIGMLRVDEGKIFFEGKDILKRLTDLRKNTGFATQENMLFNELTVKENSYYFGELYGLHKKDLKDRFSELIDLLGLVGFENSLIKNLSGGMAKRANLLVALIHKPKLLILDEPTVGLDPLLRKNLWRYIHKINDEEGMTIFVISHLLEEMEENCTRIGILKNGNIVALATPSEYKAKYKISFGEIFQEVMRNESL